MTSHHVHHGSHSNCSGELFQQLNLFRPNHLNPWPGSRPNNPPDTNTFVFQRLRLKTGGRQAGERPSWNSHSEVPCPVPSKVQIGGCPCLPDGQYLALDQRKTPNPSQNIARTFRVFYDGGIGPDASFSLTRAGLGGQKRRCTFFVVHISRNDGLALHQKLAPHQRLIRHQPHKGGLTAIAVGRVIFSTQPHVTTCKDSCQRPLALLSSLRLSGESRLDPAKTHVAPVLQAKAAR